MKRGRSYRSWGGVTSLSSARRAVFCAACAAVLTFVGVGCSTTGGARTIDVTMVPGGRVTVARGTVRFSELPERLRSLGVSAPAEIVVAVGATSSQQEIEAVARILARAGFTKVVFVRPRKAEAK